MKYIVMECHLAYAIVLDENGRFLKVANMHYEVGQTVHEVVHMNIPEETKPKKYRWFYSFAAMAACFILFFTTFTQLEQITYASIYLTINPEVRIDVNRKDVVVHIEGMNEDGKHLLENYNYQKKHLDLVMDELIERAIDFNYLHEGGQIKLVLEADDDEWVVEHNGMIVNHMQETLGEKLHITIEINDHQSTQIIIPKEDTDYGESDYGLTDYGDSDYAEDDDETSDYGDSNYDKEETSDYEIDEDFSDYAEEAISSYEEESYSESDYSQSFYEVEEDSSSDYEAVSNYVEEESNSSPYESNYEETSAYDDSDYDQDHSDSEYNEDDEDSDDDSDYEEDDD